MAYRRINQETLNPIWYFPKIRGPQYIPQHTIILVIGTPKKVPLILGNPHIIQAMGYHQDGEAYRLWPGYPLPRAPAEGTCSLEFSRVFQGFF